VMIERAMADGSEGLLLARNLATAPADAAQAAGASTVRRMVLDRQSVLEGARLRQASHVAAARA